MLTASRCSRLSGCRQRQSLKFACVPTCPVHIRSRAVLRHAAPDEGPLGGEDPSDIMKQDLERFAARQQAAAASGASSGNTQQQAQQQEGSNAMKETVDKVLIADFFFVLLALAWLGAGLAEKATLKSSTLVDAWMPLWPLVFQPAIGVLMLGALVSGGLNWLAAQKQQ